MLNTQEIIQRIVLALILGALVGLERDRNLAGGAGERGGKSSKGSKEAKQKFSFIKTDISAGGLGGLRTYILIALLGSIAGIGYMYDFSPIVWVLGGGLVMFILISFVLNYFDKNTFGLTTEISILLTFSLSLLMFVPDFDLRIIIAIAVLNIFVLSIKDQAKKLVSNFTINEIVDTAKFALVTVVILQFLPNQIYGLADIPYIGNAFETWLGTDFVSAMEIFNPYRLWLVVVLVSGISFLGYFLVKLFDKDKGLGVLGLLGGLVSSTVVTQAFAAASKGVKNKAFKISLVHAVVLANMTSFIRIFVVALALNPTLAANVALPMFLMSGFLLGWDFVNNKILGKGKSTKEEDTQVRKSLGKMGVSFSSPFAIGPALAFGGLYLLVLVFTKVALFYLGDSGFLVSTMISSISGLDAITVNTATLAGTDISYELASITIVVAASVNLMVKTVFAAIFGDKYFKGKIFILFLATVVVGIGAMVFGILF